jgi:4-amino-4-deoxy-L-arabinose transferase-like glycosyltransferase
VNNEVLDPIRLRRETRIVWGLYVLLAYFPLFMYLDVLPLRTWDEARQAMSAYEMLKDHQWLVPHYNGAPDMWSTKPPLLIWCQALFFQVLGPGELALRLPSAISAFLTGAMMVHVSAKWLRRPWMGLMAALIMCTSLGYINMHVARSGDYDAMLTMFMFLIGVCVFLYERTGSRRAITWMFIATALAILTKSVQALLILPGCAVFFLVTGAWRPFLKDRRTWYGVGLVIVLVAAVYLGREAMNPGYLQAVWVNELGGRYGEVLEGHRGEWDFYIERSIQETFTEWYLLVPCAVVVGFCLRDVFMRRWTALLTCTGAGYLLVVSASSTKCEWYDAPLYPVLASLCAIFLHTIFEWMRAARPLQGLLRVDAAPFIATFLVFVLPYSSTVDMVYQKQEWSGEDDFCAPMRYMKEAVRGVRPLTADVFCYDSYNAPMLFYAHLLNDQGKPIRSLAKADLVAGQRALAGEPYVKWFIETHYEHRVVDSMGVVNVYEILGPAHEQH